MRIQFLGGAGTVTGSKFLVETCGKRVLIDCGLFQGLKELRLQNWAPFPVEPASIDAVILTHAHLDHSGSLPLLTRGGFKGKIYCTRPTRQLTKIIVLDSAKIQEEDAEIANRMGFSKHSPAKALYSTAEAQAAVAQLSPVDAGQWIDLFEKTKFKLVSSGHILGSTFVELRSDGTRVLFSGDLGRAKPLLLPPPEKMPGAEYLVLESTYGDRVHEKVSPLDKLAHVTNETLERRGNLVIPSFAVGRAQDLIYLFSRLKQDKRIPDVPIFIDSPMAIDVTEIMLDYPEWHILKPDEVRAFCKSVIMVKSQQQSAELLRRRDPCVVIAGSGMLSGGRVLQHLAERLPNERNTVLLVGYQAAGTRGRLLRDGINELKIYGQYVNVRAQIADMTVLSAHADQAETIQWLKGFKTAPRKTFIVHGEPQASDALRVRIGDALGWPCVIPKQGESFELT